PLHCSSIFSSFCCTATSTTSIYTLSLHDALPILATSFKIATSTRYKAPFSGNLTAIPCFHFSLSTIAFLTIAWQSDTLYSCDLRSEEHTSELQSRFDLVCRLLLEKKKTTR